MKQVRLKPGARFTLDFLARMRGETYEQTLEAGLIALLDGMFETDPQGIDREVRKAWREGRQGRRQ